MIDAVSTGGDISVSDVDGAYERTLGLLVENVITSKAAGGSTSVVVTAENNLLVGDGITGATHLIDGIVRGNTVRLVSTAGDIQASAHTSAGVAAIDFDRGIAFDAAGVVDVYQFLQGTELTEYRAGEYFVFFDSAINDSTRRVPGNITSDTVILDTGALLSIDGTISAQDLVELRSARDVFVSGNIVAQNGATIGDVIIEARGEQPVVSGIGTNEIGIDNAGTNFVPTLRTSGFISVNVLTLPAAELEFRALRDINVRVGALDPTAAGAITSNFTLTGFVGGLGGLRSRREHLDLGAEGHAHAARRHRRGHRRPYGHGNVDHARWRIGVHCRRSRAVFHGQHRRQHAVAP